MGEQEMEGGSKTGKQISRQAGRILHIGRHACIQADRLTKKQVDKGSTKEQRQRTKAATSTQTGSGNNKTKQRIRPS